MSCVSAPLTDRLCQLVLFLEQCGTRAAAIPPPSTDHARSPTTKAPDGAGDTAREHGEKE